MFGAIFWRKIGFFTSAGPASIKVHTPPWRYLGNDGMFPEDVEPVIHLIKTLTHSTKRIPFIAKLTTGKWPDE
ncbi:MAG: hypothetical protein ABIK92_03090 [Pseudomonadota bacterium]